MVKKLKVVSGNQNLKGKSISNSLETSRVKTVPEIDFVTKQFQSKPAWRLNNADKNGDFAVPLDDTNVMHEIFRFLHSIDSNTWNAILNTSQNHHEIELSRFSKLAQRRIKDIKLDEQIGSLMSLRMTGKKRLFCYISDGFIGNLLWYDPEHQVCVSNLKNT